jgi:oxygen-independent coproporphyrinogen-3 oxidase
MNGFEFGVYVHWPFCAAKCPYCDFNSHVRRQIPEADWLDAIGKELDFAAAELIPAHAAVSSVFFGGGTPSLMNAATVGAVIDRICGNWILRPDVELTLEANPSSAEAERFRGYRGAGVNRLSLGVQSLDDSALRFLGRVHDSADAKRAVGFATSTFERVSIDLIYGRPRQNVAGWRTELSEALSLGAEHLSLYQLTIEDGTPFSSMVRTQALVPLSDEPAAELYEETQEIMDRAGLPAYEISNHARVGRECRHNLLYWRYGNYLGVGPGAHGRITSAGTPLSTTTERNPERWLTRVATNGTGFDSFLPLTPKEAAREHLLMALRLREGIDRCAYRTRWGQDLSAEGLRSLLDAQLIEDDGTRTRVTPKGRLVLNSVIGALADHS